MRAPTADDSFQSRFEGGAVWGAGVLNAGHNIISLDIGSVVDISVKNLDFLPAGVWVGAQVDGPLDLGTEGTLLGSYGTHTFHFCVLGDPPIQWKFDFTTFGVFTFNGRTSLNILYSIRSY